MAAGLIEAAQAGDLASVRAQLEAGADPLAKNEGGYTALAMAKQKHYDIAIVNMLHQAEQEAGAGASCDSQAKPASQGPQVVNFMKRPGN